MLEFFIFALVTSITPGPNNSMLMASGMRFGRKESLPHFLGIWLGFTFLFFIGGYLLSFVPEQVFEYLEYFGYVVITYIAYKIGTTKSGSEKKTGLEKPLTFIQACLFQWVNPKGVIMAISGLTAFNITKVEGSLIYFSILPFSLGVWLLTGEGLQMWLSKSAVLERTIYISLGLSMMASLALA